MHAAQAAESARLEAELRGVTFQQERLASSKELLDERKKLDLDKGFARTAGIGGSGIRAHESGARGRVTGSRVRVEVQGCISVRRGGLCPEV